MPEHRRAIEFAARLRENGGPADDHLPGRYTRDLFGHERIDMPCCVTCMLSLNERNRMGETPQETA